MKEDHFKGKSALQHIAEVQSTGITSSLEVHGAEAPGPVFAFIDAAREMILLLVSFLIILDFFELGLVEKVHFGIAFIGGWTFWKGARSAWLAWSRLARIHRIAAEEQEEINKNRPQEREELIALYGAKGFQGPLLEKVVDVLMADQERLLRVMLQEEMGYRLEESMHPLVQGMWAGLGALSGLIILLGACFLPLDLLIVLALISVGLLGTWFAWREKNRKIPAFFWSLVSSAIVCIFVYTIMEILI
jgi:vacuolar iron transporter family protein